MDPLELSPLFNKLAPITDFQRAASPCRREAARYGKRPARPFPPSYP
jgi:hypothetical protein